MSKYSTVKYVAVACKLWISQQYTKVNQYLHCLTFQYTHWLEVKKKSKDRYFSEHQSWAWSPYSRFRLNLSPLTGSNMLVNNGARTFRTRCQHSTTRLSRRRLSRSNSWTYLFTTKGKYSFPVPIWYSWHEVQADTYFFRMQRNSSYASKCPYNSNWCW